MAVSRESTIQILYGGSTTGAPPDLSDGELAYAHGSKNLFVGSGGNSTAIKVGAQILDEDDFGSDSNVALATQQSIKQYVDNSIGASAGVTSIEALTGSVNVETIRGIVHSTTGSGSGTITIAGVTATDTVIGVAKYDSDDFVVNSSGSVSLSNTAINVVTDDATTKILNLGSSTFVTGTDGIETSTSGSTLSFGLGAGTIINAKLANSAVSFSGINGVEVNGSTSTQSIALGSTVQIGVTGASNTKAGIAAFNTDDFVYDTLVSSAGYYKIGIKSGGVSNTKLANSSVSFGGVSVSLGGADATPAFDLSDATGLNASTGISGSIPNSKLTNSGYTITTGTDTGSFSVGLGQTIGVTGTAGEIEVTDAGNVVKIGLPNDVTIAGTLTVNGTVTTVNSTTLVVDDPLINLADGNAADTLDIGFVGRYTSGGVKYTGLARDANDSGKYKLFEAISGFAYNGTDNTLPLDDLSSSNTATLVCKVNGGVYS